MRAAEPPRVDERSHRPRRRRRRDRRPRDGLPAARGAARPSPRRAREGGRARRPPDRAQQRGDPLPEHVRARIPEGAPVRRGEARRPRLRRRARHPVRDLRRADRGDRGGGAAPAGRRSSNARRRTAWRSASWGPRRCARSSRTSAASGRSTCPRPGSSTGAASRSPSADEVRARGGEISTGAEVTADRRRPDGLVLETTAGAVAARDLVTCAGLHSDRLAAMTGHAGGVRIVPFRGDYAVLRPEARRFCRALDLPGPRPPLPVPGRPPHPPDRRRGLGRPERRPRLRAGGLPPSRRRRPRAGGDPRRPRLPAPGGTLLADRRGRDDARPLAPPLPAAPSSATRRRCPSTTSPGGRRASGPRRCGGTARSSRTSSSSAARTSCTSRTHRRPAATASLAIGRELATKAVERFGI